MREKLILLNGTIYVGRYYSVEFVRKNILRQSDEDITEIDRQIAQEVKQGIIASQGEVMDVEATPDFDINIGDE